MTPLDEACADLAAWYPVARNLITQPDTQPGTGRDKPGSRPPWNNHVALTLFDIDAGIRELEQEFRQQVTGRPAHQCRRPGWSDRNTLRAIDAVRKLSGALGKTAEDRASAYLDACIAQILRFPAVGLEEPPQQRPVPCPRCRRLMLRFFQLTGKVCCLGCGRRGQMMPGTVSDGYVEWEDGELT